ncbi:MAG: type III pantothenate kinase [Candidatus Omnitrophica bacterium]|nr:type III pantothenate kinase [Candidatus Omnitrophota bacterium]MDD5661043.1 type III pantothenate kinase [Candidatus Omnitrophota bacterium]
MLLAINIGNTNISAAFFSTAGPDNKILKRFSIPVKTYSKKKLAGILKSGLINIFDTVICSVVPGLTKTLAHDLKLITGKRPYILGKDAPVPIKSLYKPGQLGLDRLINAYAASRIYPLPLVVIDSGTAITFDVVSKNKVYLGGLIAPGMSISLNSLAEKTALLPAIRIGAPKKLIARDTKNSILSGVIFGSAALCKELVQRIKKHTGKYTLVLGTGGNIALIKKYSGIKLIVDKDLTLKGLSLVYADEINKRV